MSTNSSEIEFNSLLERLQFAYDKFPSKDFTWEQIKESVSKLWKRKPQDVKTWAEHHIEMAIKSGTKA